MNLVKITYIANPENFKKLANALIPHPDPTEKGRLIDLSKLTPEQWKVVLDNSYINEEDLFTPKPPTFLSDDASRWLDYWADLLRYSDLDSFAQPPSLRSHWFQSKTVGLEEIAAGQIPLNPRRETHIEWIELADRANEASEHPNGPAKGWATVLLTFGYEFTSKQDDHKYVQKVVMAIPATLNLETGQLGPTTDVLIINSRHLSSPDRDPRLPRIGTIQEAKKIAIERDTAATQGGAETSLEEACTSDVEWDDYWHSQNELFRSYQDENPRSIAEFSWKWKKGDQVNKFTFLGIASYTATPAANLRLLKLIEDIQTETPRPALFTRLLQGDKYEDEADQVIDWGSGELLNARSHHLGHMGGEFGLDKTQRLALWQTTTVESGNVISVSGPPGTGKTSMLQGFIASLVVNAALEKRPRVILAASQTNQATKNMIKAFGEIASPYLESEQTLIENRWVEGFPSYGWFFPSASQRKNEKVTPFQTLYREKLFDTALWAGGTAATSDRSGRAVSFIGNDMWQQYRNQYMRHYRSYLRSINVAEHDSPTIFLHNAIVRLVGDSERSEIRRAINHCDQLQAIFDSYSFGELTNAEVRKERLMRKLPVDKNEVIARLTKERAVLELRVDRLKSAVIATHRFPPKGVLQHVQVFITNIIPALRKSRQDKDEKDLNRLMQALLNAKPTLSLPSTKSALVDCVPKIIEEQLSSLKTLDEQIQRWSRWQQRIERIKKSRTNELAALQGKLESLEQLYRVLRYLPNLFNKYRNKFCCDEFNSGLTGRPRVHDDKKDDALFGLGSSLKEIILTAGPKNDLKSELRQKLECVLDVTVRYYAFHLSMRYWESRWLDEAREPLPKNPKDEVRAVLERAAMLAPVIVATAQTMPAIALYLDANHTPTHLLEAGDWLIVDEAGQVAPHLSLPLTALARNALVVGDVKQLAPVVDIDPRANQDLRRRHGLGDETTDHRRTNLDGVVGNMMACSQYASARHDNAASQRYGVMLRYHYRCRETIITFCNRLIYDAIDPLIPMIRDAESFAATPQQATKNQALLPPMGFVVVEGKQSANVNSQSNQLEANEILSWIKRNRDAIEAKYGCIENAVAVITPYAGQVAILQAGIKKLGIAVALKKAGENDDELGADAPRMIVDTIHSLQGAEKNIVLFSAVNDGSGKPFIDSSPSMLNVAVSRAKHSFIVFGHPNVILQPGAMPSGVLGSYLRNFGYRLYPRDLVVLESDNKVPLVEKAFGVQAKGIATGGHFRELQLDDRGYPSWHSTDRANTLLAKVKSFVGFGERHYDRIILATDDDREGEAIAWHLIDLVRNSGLSIPAGRYKRLRFYAMNAESLVEGMKSCTNGVDPLRVQAALARAIADAYIARQIRDTADVHVGRVSAALLDELDRLEMSRRQVRFREVATVKVGDDTLEFVRAQDDQPLAGAASFTGDQGLAKTPQPTKGVPIISVGPLVRLESAAPATSTATVLQRAINDLGLAPKEAMAALQEIYEGGKLFADVDQERVL